MEGHTLSESEYSALNAQATNYRTILRFLKASGLDGFLVEKKLVPLDLLITPDDMTGGESSILFLKALADECHEMDDKIKTLSEALVASNILLAREKKKVEPKKSISEEIKELFRI